MVLAIACADDKTPEPSPVQATAGNGGNGGAESGGASGSGGSLAPPTDKAALCTDTFGSALTKGFGRLDGTVLAVIRPVLDEHCPRPNGDHVIVEMMSEGAAYRMVVNVESDREEADVRVGMALVPHAALGPAFAEGWHPKLSVDYASDLDAHAPAFVPDTKTALSQKIADALTIGAKVSVYASTDGGDSAHKVHKSSRGEDGAIVLDPTGEAPTWMLFRFQNQDF